MLSTALLSSNSSLGLFQNALLLRLGNEGIPSQSIGLATSMAWGALEPVDLPTHTLVRSTVSLVLLQIGRRAVCLPLWDLRRHPLLLLLLLLMHSRPIRKGTEAPLRWGACLLVLVVRSLVVLVPGGRSILLGCMSELLLLVRILHILMPVRRLGFGQLGGILVRIPVRARVLIWLRRSLLLGGLGKLALLLILRLELLIDPMSVKWLLGLRRGSCRSTILLVRRVVLIRVRDAWRSLSSCVHLCGLLLLCAQPGLHGGIIFFHYSFVLVRSDFDLGADQEILQLISIEFRNDVRW